MKAKAEAAKVAAPSLTSTLNLPLLSRYLLHSLFTPLPDAYASLDTNRLTLVHFIIHSLDICNGLNLLEQKGLKSKVITWIYNLQITTSDIEANSTSQIPGFIGGTFHGSPFDVAKPDETDTPSSPLPTTSLKSPHSSHHIAMTYTSLLTLLTLGDDLSRVDAAGILTHLSSLQMPDGSFKSLLEGSEADMRFVYCAVCIEKILKPLLLTKESRKKSYVDTKRIVAFIKASRGYDDGLALMEGMESHSGGVYCAIASLSILGELDNVVDNTWKDNLVKWLVGRQLPSGLQGRIGKEADSCYSYWVGATLKLLGHGDLLHHESSTSFVLSCQHPKYGGIAKVYEGPPDVLHTFYSLGYLSLSGYVNVGDRVDVTYGTGREVGVGIDKRWKEMVEGDIE